MPKPHRASRSRWEALEQADIDKAPALRDRSEDPAQGKEAAEQRPLVVSGQGTQTLDVADCLEWKPQLVARQQTLKQLSVSVPCSSRHSLG